MLLDGGCVVCSGPCGPVCDQCACGLVAARPPHVDALDACRVAFHLDAAMRTIVAALKYRQQRRVASWLATRMGDLIPRGADALTWIPATPERRRQRGYDQAEQLAHGLSRITGVPTLNLLRRSSGDRRQTGLTRGERGRGPALTPRQMAPGFVVVIDDVLTTGSSLSVAGSVLRSASAQRIVGVVAAATPPPGEQCLHSLTEPSIVREWT